MAATIGAFNEELQKMKQLFIEYSKRTDIDAIHTIDQDVKDICDVLSTREANAKQATAELIKLAKDLERSAEYPEREGVHAERLAVLQRNIEIAKQLIEEHEIDCRAVQEQHEQIVLQLQKALTSAQEVTASNAKEENILRAQISMYVHITGVSWSMDKPNVVAGTISDSKLRDIRKFSFHQNSMTEFQLVNMLWDLI